MDWKQHIRERGGITCKETDPEYHRLMYATIAKMVDKDADLLDDVDFMLEAVSHRGDLLEISGYTVADNEAVVMAAVANTGNAIAYASRRLRGDRKMVRAAIHGGKTSGPPAIAYASDALRDDREMALEAIQEEPDSLLYISVRLRNDTEMQNEAARVLGISPARVAAAVEETTRRGGVSLRE